MKKIILITVFTILFAVIGVFMQGFLKIQSPQEYAIVYFWLGFAFGASIK